MKKTLTFILAAALIFSLCALSLFAANIPGDIHTDNRVDTKDATKLAQVLAGWGIVLTDAERAAADVKVDGSINSKDAVLLAQKLAGWDVTLGSGSGSEGDSGSGDQGNAGIGDIEIPSGGIFG